MDKRLTFVVYGIILWLIGVAAIRFLHPYFYGNLTMHLLFLGIAILSAPATVIGVAKLTGRTKHDMLVPTAIMAMPAMLMDGLAVTFDAMGKTHIYADNALHAAYAGGLLLIAFWATIFFALLWHRA